MYAIFKDFGKQETFTCDGCKRTFPKDWSDEEALAEMRARFVGIETSDSIIFCDDCNDQLNLIKF